MIALTALMVSSIAFAQDREYVIVVHGGAGAMAGLSSMTRTVAVVAGIGLAYRQARRVAMAGEMLEARQAGP